MEADAKPLTIWIRRFLIVAGYAIAISGTAQALLLPFAWQNYFDSVSHYGSLKSIYFLFLFASAISPALLLVGIWGFHQRKRWARRSLLIYVATWVGAALGLHVVRLVGNLLLWGTGGASVLIRVGLELIQWVNLIDPSIYPLLLLLCLMRPEFRDQFTDVRRGFSPMLNSHPPAAGDQPVAAESVEP